MATVHNIQSAEALENLAKEKLLASLSEAVALLVPARAEIERLQRLLVEAEAAQHETGLALAAAELREAQIRAELDGALSDLAAEKRQALRQEVLWMEKHRGRSWWRVSEGSRKHGSADGFSDGLALSALLSAKDPPTS